jgi:hypothetical protein
MSPGSPRRSHTMRSGLLISSSLQRKVPTRNFRCRINRFSMGRCRRNLTPPKQRSRAPNSRWIPRDWRRQHDGRADSGATRERELGIIADDNSCACRRLCHRCRIGRRRSGVAGALRDVVHCRERNHARWNVLAEWFSDHQGWRVRGYCFR